MRLDQKGPIVAEPVRTSNLTSDPRGADLQTQIQELTAALQDWRRTREYSQSTEERLARITVQCARMVETWQEVERRGAGVAGAVERRAEWGGVDSRLQHDTGERIRALERTIEHEWEALREDREEPARLTEQAGSQAESSVATADLTLRGIARTEARLAALEQDLQGRMTQLSRDLQAVVAELRTSRPQSAPGAVSAFPLESVMRIHEELRGSDATEGAGPEALKGGAARALPQGTETALALTARVESLERTVGSVADAATQSRGWRPMYLVIALILALAGATVFGLWLQRRVDARLNEAAARVSAAERQRDATAAAAREEAARTRDEAARQIADARQSAAQAQIVGNVLAAPDRIRYWLTATDASSRAYAQVLFSRSRGVVFSASRLPAAGPGKTYQLWLLTRRGPVSAGVITPDSAGRVTLATDNLSVPAGVTGAVLTREDGTGQSQPSEDRVLIRVE